MELDFVDSVAETIVCAETRRIFVRKTPPLQRLPAQKPAERARGLGRPGPTFTFQRFGKRAVLAEQIVSRKRWRLVQTGEDLHGLPARPEQKADDRPREHELQPRRKGARSMPPELAVEELLPART